MLIILIIIINKFCLYYNYIIYSNIKDSSHKVFKETNFSVKSQIQLITQSNFKGIITAKTMYHKQNIIFCTSIIKEKLSITLLNMSDGSLIKIYVNDEGNNIILKKNDYTLNIESLYYITDYKYHLTFEILGEEIYLIYGNNSTLNENLDMLNYYNNKLKINLIAFTGNNFNLVQKYIHYNNLIITKEFSFFKKTNLTNKTYVSIDNKLFDNSNYESNYYLCFRNSNLYSLLESNFVYNNELVISSDNYYFRSFDKIYITTLFLSHNYLEYKEESINKTIVYNAIVLNILELESYKDKSDIDNSVLYNIIIYNNCLLLINNMISQETLISNIKIKFNSSKVYFNKEDNSNIFVIYLNDKYQIEILLFYLYFKNNSLELDFDNNNAKYKKKFNIIDNIYEDSLVRIDSIMFEYEYINNIHYLTVLYIVNKKKLMLAKFNIFNTDNKLIRMSSDEYKINNSNYIILSDTLNNNYNGLLYNNITFVRSVGYWIFFSLSNKDKLFAFLSNDIYNLDNIKDGSVISEVLLYDNLDDIKYDITFSNTENLLLINYSLFPNYVLLSLTFYEDINPYYDNVKIYLYLYDSNKKTFYIKEYLYMDRNTETININNNCFLLVNNDSLANSLYKINKCVLSCYTNQFFNSTLNDEFNQCLNCQPGYYLKDNKCVYECNNSNEYKNSQVLKLGNGYCSNSKFINLKPFYSLYYFSYYKSDNCLNSNFNDNRLVSKQYYKNYLCENCNYFLDYNQHLCFKAYSNSFNLLNKQNINCYINYSSLETSTILNIYKYNFYSVIDESCSNLSALDSPTLLCKDGYINRYNICRCNNYMITFPNPPNSCKYSKKDNNNIIKFYDYDKCPDIRRVEIIDEYKLCTLCSIFPNIYYENNSCVSSCSKGNIINSEFRCIPCPEGLYQYDNTCVSVCSSNQGIKLNLFGSKYCDTCEYFISNGYCVNQCDITKGTISNSNNYKECVFCFTKDNLVANNNKCLNLNNNIISYNNKCPEDKLYITDIVDILNVKTEYSYCIDKCNENMVYEDNKCKQNCEEKGNTSLYSNKNKCEYCPDNKYLFVNKQKDSNICVENCPYGLYNNDKYYLCEECSELENKYFNNNKCIKYEQCPITSYPITFPYRICHNCLIQNTNIIYREGLKCVKKCSQKYNILDLDEHICRPCRTKNYKSLNNMCVENCPYYMAQYFVILDKLTYTEIKNTLNKYYDEDLIIKAYYCDYCYNKYAFDSNCYNECPIFTIKNSIYASKLNINIKLYQQDFLVNYCEICPDGMYSYVDECLNEGCPYYLIKQNLPKYYANFCGLCNSNRYSYKNKCYIKCPDYTINHVEYDSKYNINIKTCIECNESLYSLYSKTCVEKCPYNMIVYTYKDNNNYTFKYCKLCENNKYAYNNKCIVSCPTHTKSININKKDYYVYNNGVGNYCINCNNLEYNKDNNSVIYSFIENGYCVEKCSENKIVLNSDTNECICDIKNNYILDDYKCVKYCPPKSIINHYSKTCETCKYLIESNLCVKNCSINKYINKDGECKCDHTSINSKYFLLDNNLCVEECDKRFSIINYKDRTCKTCKKYIKNNKCIDKCPDLESTQEELHYLYNNSKDFDKFDKNCFCYLKNNYLLNNLICVKKCPENTIVDIDNKRCHTCNYYIYKDMNICLKKCPMYTFTNDFNKQCYDCGNLYYEEGNCKNMCKDLFGERTYILKVNTNDINQNLNSNFTFYKNTIISKNIKFCVPCKYTDMKNTYNNKCLNKCPESFLYKMLYLDINYCVIDVEYKTNKSNNSCIIVNNNTDYNKILKNDLIYLSNNNINIIDYYNFISNKYKTIINNNIKCFNKSKCIFNQTINRYHCNCAINNNNLNYEGKYCDILKYNNNNQVKINLEYINNLIKKYNFALLYEDNVNINWLKDLDKDNSINYQNNIYDVIALTTNLINKPNLISFDFINLYLNKTNDLINNLININNNNNTRYLKEDISIKKSFDSNDYNKYFNATILFCDLTLELIDE